MTKRNKASPALSRQRRGQSGPTVADVARLALVSPMTVSRVVNGDTNVQQSTRDKVQAAIRTLAYVPNKAARSLASGQQCKIGLLHSNPSAAYLSEFLVGCLAEASALDAQLIVEHCSDGESAQSLIARLQAHRVDGVILPPPLCDDMRLLLSLQSAMLPMIQVATGVQADFSNAIGIDDEAAAQAMVARLIGFGHRRIGLIEGNQDQAASRLRRKGYAAALQEAGIPIDPSLIAPGSFTYRSGLSAASRLLNAARRPTAIFACNDDMAAASIAVAHRMGLDVPGDLSVCGFDDTSLATTIWPELTTVRQPIAEMARRAMTLLIEAVRANNVGEPLPVRHERMAFQIIERFSAGSPGASARSN